MTDTVVTNYEIQVPLDDINIITLDRVYVESKCEWQEMTDRTMRYRLKD